MVEVELAEATALLAAVDSLSMHLTLNVGEHGGNPMLLLLPQLQLLFQPLRQLLPLSLLFVQLGLQDFTPMSQCETKICNQPTNDPEITWIACMLDTKLLGHGSMGRVESVVLARS